MTDTRFVIQGEIDSAVLFVSSQVEFWNKTCNDLAVQALGVWEGKVFEAASEFDAPLAHDVIGRDLLGLEVVGGASDNYIHWGQIPIY